MKPGKHQRSKQRCQDLCWKVRDPAQSFVLRSYTMHELSYFHNHSPLLTMTPHRNGVAVHFNVPRDWFGKETRRIKNVTLKAAKKKNKKKNPGCCGLQGRVQTKFRNVIFTAGRGE